VQGSLEALTDALRKVDQQHEEVRLSFVHRGVGGINESDVSLAAVSNATVIGFNVRPDRKARELAQIDGGSRAHRGHRVGGLVRDRLQRRARQMRASRTAREAHDRSARVWVPVRRTEAGKRRHEVDAVVALQRGC